MEEADITSGRYFEHDLQFYDERPAGSILLDDLETLVLERLRILQTVLQIAERNKTRSASTCLEILLAQLRKDGFGSFAAVCSGSGYNKRCSKERFNWRRRDHVSHIILLICMAQKPVTQKWFLNAENLLFKWRVSRLKHVEIEIFMHLNKINYPKVTEHEKKLLKNDLKPAMKHLSLFNSTKFYRVPIFEMLDTLQERHVFVKNGVAYATTLQLRTAFYLRYKRRLACRIKKLVGVQHFMGDPRLFVLIKKVQQTFNKANPMKQPTPVDVIAVDKLDEVSTKSFPPCMRRIHEGLRAQHHLRNKSRFQYTVYLKAIGIAGEAAVEFFREEFTKKITDEVFTKQYAYNFRYIYGLVGVNKEYRVPPCSKLAADTRGRTANEFHGCPMEDIEDLDKLLVHWYIPRDPRNKIVALAKKKDCTSACAAFFKASHKAEPTHSIRNPMDFYRQSVKFHAGDYTAFRNEKQAEAKIAADKVAEESEESESSSDDSEDDSAVDPKKMSPEDRERAINKKLMEFYDETSLPTE